MSTLTVSTKGQVTLGKDLVKHLGVRPGESITVTKLPGGRIEIKRARPTGKISDVFGYLKRESGPSLSIEEINEVASRGWTAQAAVSCRRIAAVDGVRVAKALSVADEPATPQAYP